MWKNLVKNFLKKKKKKKQKQKHYAKKRLFKTRKGHHRKKKIMKIFVDKTNMGIVTRIQKKMPAN